MRIGIFFGGQSREREISFAGGRTVYDNLNKDLFEAIPIFVDSLGNFILLDWQYIYKGTIRDFYPPLHSIPPSPSGFQIYVESLPDTSTAGLEKVIASVGRKLQPEEFSSLMDFAFLALHGPYGEDGNIQGILEWYNIPYSGSGILPSAIGINKSIQKTLMAHAGFAGPKNILLSKKKWMATPDKGVLLKEFTDSLGLPFVSKAPYQGSSIGISVISSAGTAEFTKAVNKSFFIQEIVREDWEALSESQKIIQLRTLTDIREGIGMPVTSSDQRINHPEELLRFIEQSFKEGKDKVVIESLDKEEEIILEAFIRGKEFSCIVIQDEDGAAISLPPTEIIKRNDFFDYRSKYLPGMTRKITPIDLPDQQINHIREQCERLYKALSFNVYARIDGFINASGEVFLNDPNTTSGMLPSSFFFHQAAEIGLNPSQFLSYIIRTSLAERIKTGKKPYQLHQLLKKLDQDLFALTRSNTQKIKVGVVMGGFSSERHISVESGRNIYEKLASSSKYEPIPVFLTGDESEHQLYVIPINIMLKDNADDIREKVINFNTQKKHPIIASIIQQTQPITSKYVSNIVSAPEKVSYEALAGKIDVAFIALHGRPGEDGAIQQELEKYNIPYNGSGIESSRISINKYETNRILREQGLKVANHRLVYEEDWQKAQDKVLLEIEKDFSYPFIAKPADDGCSSAVKKIKNRQELIAFCQLIFGKEKIHESESSRILNLKFNEEFPQKNFFLVEDLITRGDARYFLEVTGGLLTSYTKDGKIAYEIFEPSETLATGDVLSLEEKFLAGEGQNITPARFAKDEKIYTIILTQVRDQLRKVAEIIRIEGYARIDAFVRIFDDNRAETIIIEVNSLPGMTPATCIFHQTAINGYKPYDFIDRILTFGMQRQKLKLEKELK